MKKLTYDEIFSTRPTLAELSGLDRFPIYALCENIRSLYNVGSIFRTSDAVRLKKLFLTGYTGFPPRKEIDKTALGAVDSVEWERHVDPMNAIRQMQHQNIPVIVLEHTSNSQRYDEFDYPFPFCLVLGNEVEGVTGDVIAAADTAIEIPMFGLKQSLNVAVAYGIVVFHALNQYLKTNRK